MPDTREPSINVEFFGIPRERAGRAELKTKTGTLAEILTEVQKRCPRLHDLRLADGTIAPHYRISLDGHLFLTDPNEVLPPNSHLLILSADPGG